MGLLPTTRCLIYSVAKIGNVNHQYETQHNLFSFIYSHALVTKHQIFLFQFSHLSGPFFEEFTQFELHTLGLNTPALDIHQLPLNFHWSQVLSQEVFLFVLFLAHERG